MRVKLDGCTGLLWPSAITCAQTDTAAWGDGFYPSSQGSHSSHGGGIIAVCPLNKVPGSLWTSIPLYSSVLQRGTPGYIAPELMGVFVENGEQNPGFMGEALALKCFASCTCQLDSISNILSNQDLLDFAI